MKRILIFAALLAGLVGCSTTETPAQQEQAAKAREATEAGAQQLGDSGVISDGNAVNPPKSDFSIDL